MVEIIKKVNRVARKPHRCDYCHMMIYEGEEYSYSFLKCNEYLKPNNALAIAKEKYITKNSKTLPSKKGNIIRIKKPND